MKHRIFPLGNGNVMMWAHSPISGVYSNVHRPYSINRWLKNNNLIGCFEQIGAHCTVVVQFTLIQILFTRAFNNNKSVAKWKKET